MGGLTNLKDFCRRALQPGKSVKPRGILLLGVPGVGKSCFARALGNEVSRPTLLLDIGTLYGSLVGATEANIRQALRIADAMSPSVLFVDELEKALSGVGGTGDSGVATRLFGTLLTYLSDRTSDTFVIGTCNDISKLPPEFSRAERWDSVFFLDLPNGADKNRIWELYRRQFNISESQARPDDTDWTGAEICSCCRLAALLEVPLTQAAHPVVPVAVTAAEAVVRLRSWASGRCLSASSAGIYPTATWDRSSSAAGKHRLRPLFGLTFFLEIVTMTTTTSTRTASNGQPRKTLSRQLDRLDGILDGLDAALSGAVQDAVEQAVKQAVQTVLTEVMTNRELQEQLQQASQPSQPPEEPHGKPSMANRLWQSTTENVRRTVQTVQRLGRGVGMALVAAGAAVAGIVYAARKQIASVTSDVYRNGKRLVHGAISSVTSFPAVVRLRRLRERVEK